MNIGFRSAYGVVFAVLLIGFACQAWAEPISDSSDAVALDEDAYEQMMNKEFKMFKFRDCPYTEEMGAHTFQCIKDNNGFNAHGCYDDSLKLFCPQPGD
ncbi:MAG: hypothetical protein O3B03_03215 [Proteobacteria bacterium]|nr:hypothetical protein [Pseudomonadota bacterium]MDA1332412.1 hypothetical protein [Pseudomonadota bacterium]